MSCLFISCLLGPRVRRSRLHVAPMMPLPSCRGAPCMFQVVHQGLLPNQNTVAPQVPGKGLGQSELYSRFSYIVFVDCSGCSSIFWKKSICGPHSPYVPEESQKQNNIYIYIYFLFLGVMVLGLYLMWRVDGASLPSLGNSGRHSDPGN